MVKFVEIDGPAKTIGKKNMLHAQMELISITKRYQNYKKIKRLKYSLKKLLRKKIFELGKLVLEFDSLLPIIKDTDFAISSNKEIITRSDVEIEIEEIRRKIKALG